ncbi:MAG: phosphoglycerate kinase [Clostridia bacterium]|uniref:Phosphoglycerate kinase n=1 Tax=Thermacetogenium phaeum TaxID=85874 RepID=A0A101FH28_9THEO|nr:MAG: Phosphoglycerate kinase [Thermacetogenium phaeum]MDK2881104.1 phosphoglycerate kinase [Clostridia bacterium]MDN5366481.1 phosphoglycerate kinase [Thermacetogenium sp.]MDN5375856.1 phosphoglycerate kinase [Thermacetogenium sp.]
MKLRTIREIDVGEKKVLVRVDFNVPLDDQGNVTDDTRIKAALPTIRYLLDRRARVILMSHLGRPKGKVVEGLRMTGVARRLGELLGQEVKRVDECVGPEVEKAVQDLRPGEVLLLENLRFHPEEEKNDPEFARKLASLADIYVNDAFGTAHRAHASTAGVASYLPAFAGFLMEKEVKALGSILTDPAHPFVAVLGGAKVADKIGVLNNLVEKVDTILFGGGMANTFLLAQGRDVGDSLVDREHLDFAREFMQKARQRGVRVELPEDLAIAPADGNGSLRVVDSDAVPSGWRALDIGPRTAERYAGVIQRAKTAFWNGPMGVFEKDEFARGSEAVARALAESDVVSVVGGGDSLAVLEKFGLADKVTHASTGGGASLEFLEGRELPGVAVLAEK